MAILKDTRINGALIADRYHHGSSSQPAIYFDKPGGYVAGVGPTGSNMTVQFGCADSLGGNWSSNNTMIWKYIGKLDVSNSQIKIGAYDFKFPYKTGTVALLDDIPTIPSIPNPISYYWADVHISSTSSIYTSPTFSNVTASSFYASSDIRLKKNIIPINDFDWYDLLNKMKLYKYDWKDDIKNIENTHCLGAIAQEVQDIMPDEFKKYFVHSDKSEEKFLSINDNKLIYVVIGALQQQIEINKKLEDKVNNLELELNKLKEERYAN